MRCFEEWQRPLSQSQWLPLLSAQVALHNSRKGLCCGTQMYYDYVQIHYKNYVRELEIIQQYS